MYIPMSKSCAVQMGSGCKKNKTAAMLLDMGDDRLQSALDNQIHHRRTTHKLSEQRRRKILNSRFEDLRDIVPACRDNSHTKQTILSKALQYIDQIKKNLKFQEDAIMILQKEKERQADLARQHQEWQRKLEYMRKGCSGGVRTMHHITNINISNVMQQNSNMMSQIATEAI